MIRYDDVGSLSKKLTNFVVNMNIYSAMAILVIISIIALVLGLVNESIITAQSILIIIITAVTLYIYFKKQYSNKIKALKLKYKILKKKSILDELCGSKKTHNPELCSRYQTSKNNFDTISNMILQKYNMED